MASCKLRLLYHLYDKICRNCSFYKSNNNMNRIVAFGNPLLDTVVIIKDNSLLKKYNLSKNGQKEITRNEMESLTEDLKDYEKSISSGGCAQNTLNVIQWLLRKQCTAIIFGSIGNDKEGEILQQMLKNTGVEPNFVKQDNYPTGISIALVSGADRSLVASLGAAEVLSLNDVKSNSSLLKQIDSADLVYMEGFFLPKRIEVASFILNYCTVQNKIFAFNVSAEYICREHPKIVQHFIEKSSIIFGNKQEFDVIRSHMQQEDIETLLKYLSKGGKTIIVTNGPEAVICVSDGKQLESIVVPTMREGEIVDTTGAGDSFAAGFLVGYLLKRSLINCVELGCYAAQEIIRAKGCVLPTHPPGVLL